MRMPLTSVIAPTLTVVALAGCATKGFVKDQVAQSQKLALAYADSASSAAVAKEASARTAGDEELQNKIAAQQAALDTLRTQFHAAVAVVGSAVRFAMPVNFAFDDATVRQTDYPALDRLAAVVNKFYAGSIVTVEGFADPAGSAAYNRALSQRRAEAVAQYLETKGLDSTRVRAVGYGKTRLVNAGAQKDDAGAEQNRRVTFVVETAGQPPEGSISSTGPGR